VPAVGAWLITEPAGTVVLDAVVTVPTLSPAFVSEVVAAAWDYFNNTQTRTQKYEPLIRPQDQAAIEWNQDIMAKYRDKMRPYYFDPTKYKTYLEQLGIKYPVIKK